jgi:4a-hydroxytetrahydrobiopterin dehydratase
MSTWQEQNNKLMKEFSFEDFKQALEFVNKVGEIAEELGHHPEIWFTFGKVKIETTSHDQGSVVTDKDKELAEKVDALEV